MKVVLCATAKNEHLYVNDWVKYYLNLGVDHIYIFDNDDPGSPYILDFVDEGIRDRVTIFDIRGKREDGLQQHSYTKFYTEHMNEFDWCAFFDLDEYLWGLKDIKKWLAGIPENFKQVRIKFKTFDDNGLIERDISVPVYEALTHPHPTPYDLGMKSIVRGGIQNIFIHSVHFSSFDGRREKVLPQCKPSGLSCGVCQINIRTEALYSGETIFLNHYRSKTLSEFIRQKLNRSDCVFADKSLTLDYFFATNDVTKEKLAYLKAKGFDYIPKDQRAYENVHTQTKVKEHSSELDSWLKKKGR